MSLVDPLPSSHIRSKVASSLQGNWARPSSSVSPIRTSQVVYSLMLGMGLPSSSQTQTLVAQPPPHDPPSPLFSHAPALRWKASVKWPPYDTTGKEAINNSVITVITLGIPGRISCFTSYILGPLQTELYSLRLYGRPTGLQRPLNIALIRIK